MTKRVVPASHKFCPDCRVVKPHAEFHRNASKSDGLQDQCRSCHGARAAVWIANNREKRMAHEAVQAAIRSGRLVAQLCACCGEPAEAHHADYSRPLDVVWLCCSHHRTLHAEHKTYLAEKAALLAIETASESSLMEGA